MFIEGPITIGFVDDDQTGGRELNIGFKREFHALNPAARHAEFQQFLAGLRQAAAGLPENDSNRRGMLLVLQVVEEIAPYLAGDEIPLEDGISVEIHADLSLAGLAEKTAQ